MSLVVSGLKESMVRKAALVQMNCASRKESDALAPRSCDVIAGYEK